MGKVRELYESDLIKIITGIRRSGKSIILEQIKITFANILYLFYCYGTIVTTEKTMFLGGIVDTILIPFLQRLHR